jgi:hypothetical protein
LDAITSTKKENLQKIKLMLKMTKTVRQTEEQDNKPIKTQTGSRKPPEKINS